MYKKNSGYYFDATYNIIYNEYKDSNDHLRLTRPKIAELISNQKSEEENLKGKMRYTSKQVQPSVYRALKALMEAKKILLIDDKYYAPYTFEGARYLQRSELEKLPFNEDGIFFVSPSTILLSIRGLASDESIQPDDKVIDQKSENEAKQNDPKVDKKKTKKLFKEYLTAKHCFNIHINSNYVVLLIKGNDEDLKDIGDDLTYIAKRSWELQNQPKMNFRKRKSSIQVAKEREEKLAKTK